MVARNIPGNKEVVQDGVNGLLFEDEEDFLEKLDRVYEINRSQIEPLNTLENEKAMYQQLSLC